MKPSIDMQQRLTEIEHALSRRFASPSTSVTHLADSKGRLTFQVSWVESAAEMNILDARCALSVVLASRTMNRYASMSTADRVRARERLCGIARDTAHDAQRTGHAAGCSATLDVSEPMLEEAARAWPRVAKRVSVRRNRARQAFREQRLQRHRWMRTSRPLCRLALSNAACVPIM